MVSDIGNKEIIASNIRFYMGKVQRDRNDMCKLLGVPYTTFTDWVNAKTYPRIDKIEMMANLFNIEKSDLIERRGRSIRQDVPTTRIPVLGAVSAGLPIEAQENVEGYVYSSMRGAENCFALRVKGDSMDNAHVPDGAVAVIHKQPTVENGEIAVVMVDNQDATLKYFKQNGRTIVLSPRSSNLEHQHQIYDTKETDIKVLGKLVRVEIDGDLLAQPTA